MYIAIGYKQYRFTTTEREDRPIRLLDEKQLLEATANVVKGKERIHAAINESIDWAKLKEEDKKMAVDQKKQAKYEKVKSAAIVIEESPEEVLDKVEPETKIKIAATVLSTLSDQDKKQLIADLEARLKASEKKKPGS